MRKIFLLSLLSVLVLATWGARASASDPGIHRCIGEDGVLIFADRACSAFGARDHRAEVEIEEPMGLALPTVAQDCAREIDALKRQVRSALETGDVNQLSGLYHWLDASNYTADRIMPGLEVIIKRHLVEIEMDLVEVDGQDQPVRLWLAQYDPGRPGETVHTSFGLIMNAGCWWLRG